MREGWIGDGWRSMMRERLGPDGGAVDLKRGLVVSDDQIGDVER